MMHTWFECKIRYEKMAENGTVKKVTEPYLVDALSFTEAEKRIIEEMSYFISGEFTVSDIKRANYSELFSCEHEESDRWFKCKVSFITLNEKNGTEKRTTTQMLVQASGLREAVKRLDEGMKGTMTDYEIVSVSETQIMGVFMYEAQEDKVKVELSGNIATIDRHLLDTESFEVYFDTGIRVLFERRREGIFAIRALDRSGVDVLSQVSGKSLKYHYPEKKKP